MIWSLALCVDACRLAGCLSRRQRRTSSHQLGYICHTWAAWTHARLSLSSMHTCHVWVRGAPSARARRRDGSGAASSCCWSPAPGPGHVPFWLPTNVGSPPSRCEEHRRPHRPPPWRRRDSRRALATPPTDATERARWRWHGGPLLTYPASHSGPLTGKRISVDLLRLQSDATSSTFFRGLYN
jgi:hypothetical protein